MHLTPAQTLLEVESLRPVPVIPSHLPLRPTVARLAPSVDLSRKARVLTAI